MPAEHHPQWRLEGFVERLDQWITLDVPDDNLRLTVTAWVMTRFDRPYQGVRREAGFDNLWFGVVPGSQLPPGQVVVCSYWIEETTHTVRCDSIASLTRPA